MRLTCVILVALLAAASPAMAWNTGGSTTGTTSTTGATGGTGTTGTTTASTPSTVTQHQGQHQTAVGGAGGAGGAGGSARATGGRATASGGNVVVNNEPGAGGGGGGGGNHGWSNNVPPVYAPSIEGGNTCAVGTSGGVGVAGFGIALGTSYAARACELRAKAALLWNLGQQSAAVRLLCTDDDVAKAMGNNCNAPSPTRVDYPPDWCLTADAGERRQHKECVQQ